MKIFSIILALFPFAAALAQESSAMKKPMTFDFENSSAYHREGKRFMVYGQPIGVGPSPTVSLGGSFGWYLNPSAILSLEGTSNSTNTHSLGSSYDIKTSSLGVHYKQFVGNSFYLKGGLDQRFVKYSYTSSSWFWSEKYTSEFDSSSTIFSFAIGNQWQFENFTIGCDWAGFIVPLAWQINNENKAGNLSKSIRDDIEEDKSRYSSQTIAQGLRFYLGASF